MKMHCCATSFETAMFSSRMCVSAGAPAAAPSPQPNPEIVTQLTAMGFSENGSKRAAVATQVIRPPGSWTAAACTTPGLVGTCTQPATNGIGDVRLPEEASVPLQLLHRPGLAVAGARGACVGVRITSS